MSQKETEETGPGNTTPVAETEVSDTELNGVSGGAFTVSDPWTVTVTE